LKSDLSLELGALGKGVVLTGEVELRGEAGDRLAFVLQAAKAVVSVAEAGRRIGSRHKLVRGVVAEADRAHERGPIVPFLGG
jgi:hypothetical protein